MADLRFITFSLVEKALRRSEIILLPVVIFLYI
jgi:hypothetical protein